MQDRKQSGVDDQRLRISDQLGQDGASQGFQEAPELPHAAVERGRMKADHPREQVGEEASGVAQEGAFGFTPRKLLEEREGEDLRVREPLEGIVAAGARVEMGVGVVDLAEQGGDGLFQECGRVGYGVVGPSGAPLVGRLRMALFLSHPTTQHTSSEVVSNYLPRSS